MKLTVRKGQTTRTDWCAKVEDAELTDSQKGARWYAEFGHLITRVQKMSVAHRLVLDNKDTDWSSPYIQWDHITVITTEFGKCCVVEFQGGIHEIQGVITGNGCKAEAKTLMTWRKNGIKRGHGMNWLRMLHARGICKSPESGRDICAMEAFERMAGRRLGVAA